MPRAATITVAVAELTAIILARAVHISTVVHTSGI